MVKDLKEQLKSTEDEQEWLKKEIDQVSSILQQKNKELSSCQKQLLHLEDSESKLQKNYDQSQL